MAVPALDFTGQTALVIGGTTGIGRAAAIAFAEAGANVVIAGLGEAAGWEVEAEIRKDAGSDALFVETDVTSEDDMRVLMARAEERFGRIHVAVNNAGTEGKFGPVQDLSSEDFDRIIAINLKGIWLGLKHQIPHMLAQGGGAIVNTASSAGVTGIANVAVYTASKHGVVGLTKATALELAQSNIRVNAVARMIEGKMDASVIAENVPMRRISEPEEIAGAILWLCSDAASYVTGHTLVVDGGMTVP
jgi:NAD(P)-dependent dehydrogenase (short-subunit alcohol dehydrogenase family)